VGLVFIHKLLKLILPPSNNICTSSPGHANQCVCEITEMPLQISAPIHPPVTRPTTPLPRALAQLSVSLAAAGASAPPPGHRGRPGRMPPSTSGVASVFRADEDELFPPARARVAVALAGRSRAPASSASRVAVAVGPGLHRRELSPCGGVARSSHCATAARNPCTVAAWRGPAAAPTRWRRGGRDRLACGGRGVEWVWPLCVECQATGRGTVAAATRTIERRSKQIRLSVRFLK